VERAEDRSVGVALQETETLFDPALCILLCVGEALIIDLGLAAPAPDAPAKALPELLPVHRGSLIRSSSPELAWTSSRTL
jgi:hypothetical protein